MSAPAAIEQPSLDERMAHDRFVNLHALARDGRPKLNSFHWTGESLGPDGTTGVVDGEFLAKRRR